MLSLKIKLLNWDQPLSEEEGKTYLVKLGYRSLDDLALELVNRDANLIQGLVPPFDLDHLAYTFRCMAMIHDHFPHFDVYAPVPKWCAREAIRSAKSAGFNHFILQFVDPWAFQHQVVHDLLADAKGVHVAGGDPKVEGWTWSEEGL